MGQMNQHIFDFLIYHENTKIKKDSNYKMRIIMLELTICYKTAPQIGRFANY